MAKELNLSEAQKTSILNTIFKNWIEKEQRKFVSKSTSDPGTDDQYFEKILKIIDEILPNYKIDQNDNLSHLLTFKNKKFVNTVVEKYPELKTQPIYDGKTASEWNEYSKS
jgi:hypothetical protein